MQQDASYDALRLPGPVPVADQAAGRERLDVADRAPHQRGGLGLAEVFVVAQYHGSPLPRRQRQQRPGELVTVADGPLACPAYGPGRQRTLGGGLLATRCPSRSRALRVKTAAADAAPGSRW